MSSRCKVSFRDSDSVDELDAKTPRGTELIVFDFQ